MPETIEDLFVSVCVTLFPARDSDMSTTCTCPDWRDRQATIAARQGIKPDRVHPWRVMPCKHIAAVHYLLGERFDADPFLMFLLRGRSKDEIIAALRARRVGPEIETPPEAEQPSQADLSMFWSAPPQTEEVALHFALPESDALAVKRLGPAPFARDQAALTSVME